MRKFTTKFFIGLLVLLPFFAFGAPQTVTYESTTKLQLAPAGFWVANTNGLIEAFARSMQTNMWISTNIYMRYIVSSPTPPANHGAWYFKQSDGLPYARNAAGTEFNLTLGDGGGGELSDGDKGDVEVSGTGTIFQLGSQVVTLDKMTNMPTDMFLGRDTAGTGRPEHLNPAQARAVFESTGNLINTLNENQTVTGVKTYTARQTFSGPVAHTFQNISGTSIDWAAGDSFSKTITGPTTFSFVNQADNDNIVVKVIQDATGGRVVTWPGSIVWLNSTNQTTAVGANTSPNIVSTYHFHRQNGVIYCSGPDTAPGQFGVEFLEGGGVNSADLALRILDETGSGGGFVRAASPVFTGTPTIPSFASSLHSHTDAAGGGLIQYADTQFIPVGWMDDGATAPATIVTYADTRKIKVRKFSNSADNILEFYWQIPGNAVDGGGAAEFQVKWRPIFLITETAPAANEGVTFGLAGASVASGEDLGVTVGTEADSEIANLNTSHTTGDIGFGPFVELSITGGAAGEAAMFSLRRDQADADDDYGQLVGLIGIEIKFIRAINLVY